MEQQKNNKEMEKLVQVASDLQNLYYKKVEQMEDLKLEISDLSQLLTNLKSLISNKSFRGADEIYSNMKKESDKLSSEKFFTKNVKKEKVNGSIIKRKIFSENETLSCILQLINMSQVVIKFVDPNTISLQETSEEFIQIFLKGALVQIKENNPNLNVSYKYYKNSNLIQHITIDGINTIEEFDLITLKIQELLDCM